MSAHRFALGVALGAIGMVAAHVAGWLIGAHLTDRAAR